MVGGLVVAVSGLVNVVGGLAAVVRGLVVVVGCLSIVEHGLAVVEVFNVNLSDILPDSKVGFVSSAIGTSITGKEPFSILVELEGDSFSVRDLTCADTCSGVKYSPAAAALVAIGGPAAPALTAELVP